MANGDDITPEDNEESKPGILESVVDGTINIAAPASVLVGGPGTAIPAVLAAAAADKATDYLFDTAVGQLAEEKAQSAVEAGEQLVDDAVEASGYMSSDNDAEKIRIQKSVRLKEQCFLTYHMKQLAEIHKDTMSEEVEASDKFPHFRYQKTQLLDSPQGLTGEVLPKLFMRPGTEHLLDVTTDQIANLVPMIKLYKVVYEDDTALEVPFLFYNHTIAEDDAADDLTGWAEGTTTEFAGGVGGYQGRSGVGIKSFDWQYISGNPDTVQKDITAKLVLYFQSMDELIRIRNGSVVNPNTGETKTIEYSYLDLVVNPARRTNGGASSLTGDTSQGSGSPCLGAFDEYDSTEYEIKASVGWASWNSPNQEIDSQLRQSINYNKTNLFLSLTDHQFNINQDGTFELTISYRSRMEGLIESPKSNVLFCDKQIISSSPSFQLLIDYERQIKELSATSCVDNKQKLEDKKRDLIKVQDGLRNETYKFMITNLLKPSRWLGYEPTSPDAPPTDEPQRLIYSILTDPQAYVEYADTGKMPDDFKTLDIEHISTTDMVFKEPSWAAESSAGNIADGKLTYRPANPDEMIINFFFLGDLIDMLMTTVFDTEKYKDLDPDIRKKYSFNNVEVENLKLLLGPMQFRDPKTSEIVNINIADIPVSVREFTKFFHNKVIKSQLTVYNFKSFLKDLLHGLIQTALGESCFEGNNQITSSMRNGYLSAPIGQTDPLENKSTSASTTRVDMDEINYENPIFDPSLYVGNTSVVQHNHYIVIYMQGPAGLRYPGSEGGPLLGGKTPKGRDLDRGIHHLFIGRDRGLVTSVNFSKTNEPYLRQARLENAGAFNPVLQLSDVYEASIEMMGNTFFLPGQRLYLNPFGLGYGENFGFPHERGTISNIMGLGGYHIVTNVSNYIESGVYKTSLSARFETAGDGCVATNTTNDDSGGDCPEESSA